VRTALLLAVAALLLLAPPLLGDYQVYLLSLTLLWGILALSMGLLLGYVGEINFGQAAFVAISAYVSSLLRIKLDWSFWLAAPVALLAVVVVAALIGLITLRLRGPFFVLVMLGFGEIVRLIIANWPDLTNGPLGLRPIAPPESLFGIDFGSKLGFYYLVLATLALSTAALARLVRARTGRMLVAVREDEVLAEFVGIPVMRYKVIGLCVSAFVAGLGGLLIGPFLTVLSPGQFSIFASVDMVVMVMVGGVGTLAGPLLGAVFLIYVPELLSFTRELRPAMMGLLLILVTMFMPGGLLGAVKAASARLSERGAAGPVEEGRSHAR
jgi:branched-chain amino acid transport system permease protein